MHIRPGYDGANIDTNYVSYYLLNALIHLFEDKIRVKNTITNDTLTANNLVLTNANKELVSSTTINQNLSVQSLTPTTHNSYVYSDGTFVTAKSPEQILNEKEARHKLKENKQRQTEIAEQLKAIEDGCKNG